MPFTVLTLTRVPRSLRGDLTKWMQELVPGVYVGNFNTKVREQLWKRVCENVQDGQASLAFSYHNELGYGFATYNAKREIVDYDGIPLVKIPLDSDHELSSLKPGFSDAAKFHKAHMFQRKSRSDVSVGRALVFVDIETDGLNELTNQIIEIGGVKTSGETFQRLISHPGRLSDTIIKLTGINDDLLAQQGIPLSRALSEFKQFIGEATIVGYHVAFDVRFINRALQKQGMAFLQNSVLDLENFVKKEKLFLSNYKLSTALQAYGINEEVPHRALQDALLTKRLAMKVNKFLKRIKT